MNNSTNSTIHDQGSGQMVSNPEQRYLPNCPFYPPACLVYTTAGETASVSISAYLSILVPWECDHDCDCVPLIFFSAVW